MSNLPTQDNLNVIFWPYHHYEMLPVTCSMLCDKYKYDPHSLPPKLKLILKKRGIMKNVTVTYIGIQFIENYREQCKRLEWKNVTFTLDFLRCSTNV